MSHYTVLLNESIDGLALTENDVVIDGTANGGGHSELIASKLGTGGVLIGIDLDRSALEKTKKRLEGAKPAIHLVEDNFRNFDAIAQRFGISAPNKLLLDLGWSRNQIDGVEGEVGRGFSFQKDEPLLMTYQETPGDSDFTAAMIVNEWSEATIADIIFGYGEEQFARRIAKAIVEAREESPIDTTGKLVAIIEAAVPAWYRRRRIHPATKTFQALRIATNDELGALRETIEKAVKILPPNGRIAIISFHSIEDRIVKTMFKDAEREGVGSLIPKRPITASPEELKANPPSRSAKLRIFQKH